MRVLFASLASVGHTYPLIPLAIAARNAGHEVHFAAGEDVHGPLIANGLRPFRPADSFYEMYAEDLEPELARLRPDLVVHEWGVPGAAVAAARAGIPGIWHGFGRMIPEGIGFELPTRNTEAPGRPHLDICPPSLQDKDFLASEDRIVLRPVPYSASGVLPTWSGRHASKPLVYLTLGTAFGTPELLTTAIEALAGLDARVVVATGRLRPEQLGDVPENVAVRAWVPQAELLPYVDAVVHHGGSGTTLGALTVGAPQLFLPQGADQFANADAVSGAGAGLRLLPDEVSVDAVAEQVRKLLPQYGRTGPRDAARAIAEEIAAMPSPDEVARHLPEYAVRGRGTRTGSVRFRLGGPADAEQIAVLHAESWRRHYRGAYADAYLDGDVTTERRAVWSARLAAAAHSATVVAEQDGRLVGFVHVIFDHDPVWGSLVDNLHVVGDRHRAGVGTRLLGHAARAVAERATGNSMYLWVLEQNTAAQQFYRARGATHAETALAEAPGGDPARLNGTPRKFRMTWPDAAALGRSL